MSDVGKNRLDNFYFNSKCFVAWWQLVLNDYGSRIFLTRDRHSDQLLSSKMETIIRYPGLHHLAEKVFWNLDVEYLKICGLINQSCHHLLDNPLFWLSKFVGLSLDNQKDWIKVIKSVKDAKKKMAIISYLQWNLKKDASMDLPCYSSSAVQSDFRRKIRSRCFGTG